MTLPIGNNSFGPQDAAAMRKQMFQKLDQNGDGKITRDEMASKAPQHGHGRGPSVDRIFELADGNQDGAIDEAENDKFLETMAHHRSRHDPAEFARKIFENVDSDGTEGISKDELSTSLTKIGSDLKADDVFKLLDSDEDGTVTRSELESVLQKLFKHHGAKGTGEGGHGSCRYDKSGEVTAAAGAEGSFTAVA